MNKIIKDILKKIEDNGYEAYLVGGFVRDYLLGIKSLDVDICTNALPKDLNKIFPNCLNNKYGGINFKLKKFNFDITTYRKELKYENRKPMEIEYINNLFEDIKRRDFKINAICMNSKGFVIDLVNGMSDIESKTITTIGDCSQKFIEDPLRMLRAIRFMTTLNFSFDAELKRGIENHKDLILTLSNNRIKEELDKILIHDNALVGLKTLEEFKILSLLNISCNNLVIVKDLLGMWAQMDFEFNSAFTKEEKNNIINIRKILEQQEINEMVLFKYGLYQSIVAGEILGINKIQINKMYKRMAIHSKQEVCITSQDIMDILKIEPSETISIIMYDVVENILYKKLKNNYHEIKRYLLDKKAKWIQ